MRLFTIGFTQRGARSFFEALRSAGVRTLVDARLRPSSQLAGFARGQDLGYFMGTILGAEYRQEPLLAPTQDLLDRYRADGDWPHYERNYGLLLRERRVSSLLAPLDYADACLLCSEATPERCHRRLAAEHLQAAWGGVEIVHL